MRNVGIKSDPRSIPFRQQNTPAIIMSKHICDQKERHDEHQRMLRQHEVAKAERRERHKKNWHRFKILPITLI